MIIKLVYVDNFRDNILGLGLPLYQQPLEVEFDTNGIYPVSDHFSTQPDGGYEVLLERIFSAFNRHDALDQHPALDQERLRSLSVSDVVLIGEEAYRVADLGWDKIDPADIDYAASQKPAAPKADPFNL